MLAPWLLLGTGLATAHLQALVIAMQTYVAAEWCNTLCHVLLPAMMRP